MIGFLLLVDSNLVKIRMNFTIERKAKMNTEFEQDRR